MFLSSPHDFRRPVHAPDLSPSPVRGVGHSTWEDVFAIAREVRARLLIVTHHAPQSADGGLDLIESELIQEMLDAKLVCGGMEIAL